MKCWLGRGMVLLVFSVIWSSDLQAEVSKTIGDHLYAVTFQGKAVPATVPVDVAEKGVYRTFKLRYFAFTPGKRVDPKVSWEMQRVQAKRRALERAAFAFSGERQEAAQLVAALPLAYEWEGVTEGPLAEAQAAESYLQQHPDTRLEAFIRLFAAQRYRAAAEVNLNRGEFTKESEYWLLYRKHLAIALSLDQPLINLAGKAMADRPYVHLALPKQALCRETANSVPFFSPTLWLQTCLGEKGEVFQFELDVDGDVIPERFVALLQEVGNAGGPFHVFKHQADGFTRYGKIAVHPGAVRRLPPDEAGRPRLERYWRKDTGVGSVDIFTHDGGDFRLVDSREATAEDRKRFGMVE